MWNRSKLWCFFGVHEYEVVDKGTVTYNGTTTHTYYDCRCKCCGKMKEFQL